jgi:hypothetical protein
MLRLLVFCALVWGCSDGGDSTGTGGTTIFEPGPTCIAFCAKVIGECGAFVFDEASCRQGCEEDLAEESAKSEACGNAVEAVFECAAELDCQGFEDFRDRVPLDDYPCRSDVIVVDAACPQI